MKIFTKSPNLAVTMSCSQVLYCVNFRIEEKTQHEIFIHIFRTGTTLLFLAEMSWNDTLI